MRCIICGRTIGKMARRSYAYVPNGRGGTRKVYACARCEAKFDKWLDKLAEADHPVPPEKQPSKEHDDAIACAEDPERAT
jgi:DNA-directed RNA polymerase subunit RPC12/RpoP